MENSLKAYESAPGDVLKIADEIQNQLAVEDLLAKMARFKTRALEQDPDKKMYGPAMSAKILELSARFEGLMVTVEALQPAIESARSAQQTEAQAARVAEQRAEAERISALKAEQLRLEREHLERVEAEKAAEGACVRGWIVYEAH